MKQLKSWLESLGDGLPPYQIAEGPLKGKVDGTNGTRYILVGPAKIQVDSFTYEKLEIGEWVRVRYTKKNMAVNIDRIVSRNGSE